MRWMPGGRCRLKPTYAARIAPQIAWPWAPMLNRPARNASPTPSPAQISGAACAVVSVIGPMPPTAPVISARVRPADLVPRRGQGIAGPGEEVGELLRTSVSETIISSAPTMNASTKAATVVSDVDPGEPARRSGPRLSTGRRRSSGAGAPAPELVVGSLMRSLLDLLLEHRDPPRPRWSPRPGPSPRRPGRRPSSDRAPPARCRPARRRRSGRDTSPRSGRPARRPRRARWRR